MSNKGQLLQDPFLNALRREHVPVSIYLVNGIKLQGTPLRIQFVSAKNPFADNEKK